MLPPLTGTANVEDVGVVDVVVNPYDIMVVPDGAPETEMFFALNTTREAVEDPLLDTVDEGFETETSAAEVILPTASAICAWVGVEFAANVIVAPVAYIVYVEGTTLITALPPVTYP